MPFSKPAKAIGSFSLTSGTAGSDSLSAYGPEASFGGDGDDYLHYGPTRYSYGYWDVPILVGGPGDDEYIVEDGDIGAIADLGGGYDTITLETNIDDVIFAWVNNNHILGYDIYFGTTIIFIDPFGRESNDNKIEKWTFFSTTYSGDEIEQLANSGSGLLGYTSWQHLNDSGLLNFSRYEMRPSEMDQYLDNASYNSSIVGEEITEDPSKSYNFSLSSKASDIVGNWFSTSIPSASESKDISDGSKLDITATTWSDEITINHVANASNDGGLLRAKQSAAAADRTIDGRIGSILDGAGGKDILHGLGGWDIIDGGGNDDLIHGGNGRDIIDGGVGADELHGDFGWNTFKSQEDGYNDLLAIKSDQHLSNWWYGKSGNSPNGEKADFIEGLDDIDEIKIIGAATSDLTFAENVSHRGATGIGIYAKGTLEAVFTGNNLSVSQIQSMTTGDASELAMANGMWSYRSENVVP